MVVVSLPPAAGASVGAGVTSTTAGLGLGLGLGGATMTTSNVVPFPAAAVSLAAGGGGGGGGVVVVGGGGVGVSALGAKKSTLLATAAAPSSEDTSTLHLPVDPGEALETANASVVLAPRATTTEEGAEGGLGESTGVGSAAAPTEHAPPSASVEQQAPAAAERAPVAVPAFLRVTKTGPPPVPGSQEGEEKGEDLEEEFEEAEIPTTSAAAVPCSSPATASEPETLTLTVRTCEPAGSYLHATHCTISAVSAGGKVSAAAEATFFRKEQLPLVSAAPAATDDHGERKSANWSAAVVAFGGVHVGRPTAVQFPGTYPPLSPHLGATQLDHIDAFIPRMLVVGTVAAVAPPAASKTGLRYFVAMAKPSSAFPGKEVTGERSESSGVWEHQ